MNIMSLIEDIRLPERANGIFGTNKCRLYRYYRYYYPLRIVYLLLFLLFFLVYRNSFKIRYLPFEHVVDNMHPVQVRFSEPSILFSLLIH